MSQVSQIFLKVKDLARIQKPVGIKGALKAPHNVNCTWTEFFLQRSLLAQANAVLTL